MLKELGQFKSKINPILYVNDEVRTILLGEDYRTKYTSEKKIISELKKYIKSHLYIDETITDMQTYIMYDVFVQGVSGSMKSVIVQMYIFCHKDIIDDCVVEGREGNRIDILCQVVEDSLTSQDASRHFGVGKLQCNSVGFFGNQKYFTGKTLSFVVPNFK